MLLPTADAAAGPVSVAMCVSSTTGDCNCDAYTDTIQVKFCAGTGGDSDYHVYQLKNVPVCDMAYCAINGSGTHFIAVFTLYHGKRQNSTPVALKPLNANFGEI